MSTLSRVISYLLKRLTFKRFIILIILTLLALPILKAVFLEDSENQPLSEQYEYRVIRGEGVSLNKLLQISVNGVILTEATSVAGPFDFLEEGVTYGYDVKETLRRAADDPTIKGIFLTINSPGGTIPGSKAISDGVQQYKKRTGNPVYSHIRDVGASGAYWAAVSTDRVFMDTGSIVGSIGVLMGPFTYYNNPVEEGSFLGSVTTEGGIEHTYFTGGQYKDTGSPYRRLTEEERAHWQRSINNEYGVFVTHVSRYRKIPESTIVNTIKALPYDSIEAKQLRLVDEIGSEDTALQALADKAGLGDNYQLIYEQRKGDFFTSLFSVAVSRQKPQASTVCSLCNAPLFLYDRTYSMLQER
jgi:protease IV